MHAVSRPFSRKPAAEIFWALRDVTFDVQPGDVVGIVGRNGAGKSTLLKVLSRITPPSAGRVVTRGRMASLLEVGTGFHPELTGRENVYLNGAILRMSRAEIQRKFDEIVVFAEIERFLDTPLKRYSSGMYLRLAFAVAAYLDPEILVVDEVLAVGDAQFQRKCLGKMSEVAGEGRTIVFVSHNMGAVRALCRTGVLLHHGELQKFGPIDDVVSAYLRSDDSGSEPRIHLPVRSEAHAQVVEASVVDAAHHLATEYPFDSELVVQVRILVRAHLADAYIALHVHDDSLNTVLFSRHFLGQKDPERPLEPGEHAFCVTLPASLLVPGRYSISVHLAKLYATTLVDGFDHQCAFDLVDSGSVNARLGLPWRGRIALPLPWTLQTRSSSGTKDPV
jgi:lipopolysaccharide transport system ATP-binding protein